MRPHFALYGAACTALLTMMLYVPGAAAQNAARATIPFAFTANERMLPAGTYQVQLEGRSYLSLKNCETGEVLNLMARPTEADQKVDRSKLVFHNTGHKYWLTNVQFAYTNTDTMLARQPRLEPGMAKNQTERTVEIAMVRTR